MKGASNKAKCARRVVEVFEYFDSQNRHATVMDIVRRYKRPQSSTSELMASLVDMGLLYKDPISKFYSPTPRAAILGALGQPTMVRDGALWALINEIATEAGLSVALLGMVGVSVQVFHTVSGRRPIKPALAGGQQERLVVSAAGHLLMSTLPLDRRDGLLRRLNAEAAPEQKFNAASMRERVDLCARQGHAMGPSGFGATNMVAVLAPVDPGERPLALALVYDEAADLDETFLLDLLHRSVERCIGRVNGAPRAEPGFRAEQHGLVSTVS